MTSEETRDRQRLVKAIFGLAALISVLTGLAIYIFADSFGLDEFTANIIAAAFLIAGVGDYFVLHFWDRLVPPQR